MSCRFRRGRELARGAPSDPCRESEAVRNVVHYGVRLSCPTLMKSFTRVL